MIFFDTEDNSKELTEQWEKENPLGWQPKDEVAFMKKYKRVSQIASIDEKGRKKFFTEPEKFLNFLKTETNKSKTKVLVYAHNLQYDLGNLFANSLDCLDVTMVGGRIIKAIWGNVEFRDTFNIWPMSAKKIGKAFGIEKLDFNLKTKEYVFRDVEIIRKAILFSKKLALDFDVEFLPATLGGLCVKIWKSLGGFNFQDSLEFHREALFGGRTELFSTGGNGNIYYTDINSLYPYVMTKEFPEPCEACLDLKKYGISKVKIKIPKSFICPLPVRREDGAIYYPYGEVIGTWTNAEIFNAIDHGAKLLKFYEGTGTDNAFPFYKTFVQTFYEKRLKAKNDASKLMYKLLMNNLYGHLGMSGEIIRSLYITEIDKALGFCEGIPYGQKKLCTQEIPLPETCNYLHAAYITSYGRLELQKYLRLIDWENLIYCDTDSIIFFHDDKKELPFKISNHLGSMKLEGKAESCETFAPKTYVFGDEYKAKGVRKDLAKEFIETGQVDYSQPFKFRESVLMYNQDNAKPLSIWRHVNKRIRTKYDKKILKSGYYFPCKIN